ncbi:MAG: GNAT family N-acetyltransferase [Nocardioidaceae bacterium]|nr:GNAT family N-acetyltransferase [Nocardioidaceae bacterium]
MPPELALRPADKSDAARAAQVLLVSRRAAENRSEIPVGVHSDDEVRRWFSDVVMVSREVWVAEAAGLLVAVLVLDDAWLDHLYVLPDHSGRGIGSALLDLAKAVRPDGFSLWVFQRNVPAQRFYLGAGLVEVERTDGNGNEERAPDIRYRWER